MLTERAQPRARRPVRITRLDLTQQPLAVPRRIEPHRSAAGFVTGLLADLQVKTSGHARSKRRSGEDDAEEAGCHHAMSIMPPGSRLSFRLPVAQRTSAAPRMSAVESMTACIVRHHPGQAIPRSPHVRRPRQALTATAQPRGRDRASQRDKCHSWTGPPPAAERAACGSCVRTCGS